MQMGLNACVLRIGNITNRYSDCMFQLNVSDNAFVNRLKSIIKIGIIQEEYLNHALEFTPVDICAKAIISIINSNPRFTVFHLFNDNFIKIKRLLEILNSLGINISPVSNEEFSKQIRTLLKDKILKSNLSGIITDLNEDRLLDLINYNIPNSEFTKEYLKKLNFKWPLIDYEYISKYIEYFKDIKYM